MPEPIQPVTRRDDGMRQVAPVERVRLLSPGEREQARRAREQARRKAAERTGGRPGRPPAQGGGAGVDYSV